MGDKGSSISAAAMGRRQFLQSKETKWEMGREGGQGNHLTLGLRGDRARGQLGKKRYQLRMKHPHTIAFTSDLSRCLGGGTGTKSTGYSYRGPRFDSQSLHGSS